MSDDELVEQALGGDREAFGELVERHQAAVFRTALTALRSREEAEDVTQDTFVSAFRELARFRGEASFKTWLFTIAWNRMRDRRRSLRRWLLTFSSQDDGSGGTRDAGERAGNVLGASSAALSNERALIDEQAHREVRKLVSTLPPKYRDPLLLAVFGEQTFEAVGRVLGIPEGTAKWRAAEARRILRVKLERRGYGRGTMAEGER